MSSSRLTSWRYATNVTTTIVKQIKSLAGFDVAPPIGVASRSRDLMFSFGNEEHQERYFHVGRF